MMLHRYLFPNELCFSSTTSYIHELHVSYTTSDNFCILHSRVSDMFETKNV